MNSSEFFKWFASGFINAWLEDMRNEQTALTEIASMTYFPRLRVFPENLRRFATLHNVRILDVLFLGTDDENGTDYYYIHGHTLTSPCCAMLVKQTREGTIRNLTYSNNRVAATLVAKCSAYVHDTSLASMLSMFVARVTASHDETDNRESVSNDREQGD
jgi:hypothetical protein